MLKKYLLVFLVLAGSAFTASAQQATTQLINLLRNLQTMQAGFTQIVQDGNGNTTQQSQGRMALQRPGLFRWETTQPNQQLIVADGRTIWIYDKDLQQITRQTQNTMNNNSPGLLLSASLDHLARRFTIQSVNAPGNQQAFKLIPKGKHDLFQSVVLYFSSGTLQQMAIQDNFGQTTQIHFSRVKTNTNLPASLFHFVPPGNVDVVNG